MDLGIWDKEGVLVPCASEREGAPERDRESESYAKPQHLPESPASLSLAQPALTARFRTFVLEFCGCVGFRYLKSRPFRPNSFCSPTANLEAPRVLLINKNGRSES